MAPSKGVPIGPGGALRRTAAEADLAGPWSIEEIPGRGFGLFQTGESLGRGFQPSAVFTTRWLAIVVAAILPGVGRDPYLRLESQAGPEGYAVLLHGRAPGGEVVGHLPRFDEPLIDAANGASLPAAVAGVARLAPPPDEKLVAVSALELRLANRGN